MDAGKRQGVAPKGGGGAVEPRQDAQPLDDDEVELIGDLGNEFDDPEGWMSERPDYWTDLGDPPLPTRAQFLRHRIGEFIALLRSFMPGSAPAWPIERIPEAVWRRAAHEVFGPDSLENDQLEADLGGAADGSVCEAKTGVAPDFENPARRAERVGTTPSDANGIAIDSSPRTGRLPEP